MCSSLHLPATKLNGLSQDFAILWYSLSLCSGMLFFHISLYCFIEAYGRIGIEGNTS